MTYLDPSEYETFGLESTTPVAHVAAASSLIDAHCRRATLAVAAYTERRQLRAGRNALRLSYLPLATVAPAATPITAFRARYALPRRGEGVAFSSGSIDSESAFGYAQAFALPGTWTTLDASSIDYDNLTGEITFPMNPLGLVYNEVEVTYNAGYAVIPDAMKFACAQLVKNMQATPALNVSSQSIDSLRMDYFQGSLLDESVMTQLAPFVTVKLA